MPGPTLTFSFIAATLFGAVFHFIMGGDARRLALFLLAGWIGFGLGHVMGDAFGITFFSIGELNMLAASVGALVALIVAHLLTSKRPERRVSR